MNKGIKMNRDKKKRFTSTYSLRLSDGDDFCSHIDRRFDLSMCHVYVESIFNHIRHVSYFTFGTSICHWSSNWQMSMFLYM